MIDTTAELNKANQERETITEALSLPETVTDPARLKELGQRLNELDSLLVKLRELEAIEQQLPEVRLLVLAEDAELAALAQEDLTRLTAREQTLGAELNEFLNPSDPNDKRNAIIEVRAGTGGEEAELFAGDLFRMYGRYAETKGYGLELSSVSRSDLGGIREAIFTLKGANVYGQLKFESGVHRVQRIPETEKMGRIHTSAASVAVFPEVEETELVIDPKDIKVDVYRSSGPGGQSVNTTDSAVRLTHLPSGLVVTVQDEKSQHKNKDKAMKILRARLAAKIEEERQAVEGTARKEMIKTGDRSEKIRTYNYPQDRITDHRIKQSWSNIKGILDGNLEPVIKALKQTAEEAATDPATS